MEIRNQSWVFFEAYGQQVLLHIHFLQEELLPSSAKTHPFYCARKKKNKRRFMG